MAPFLAAAAEAEAAEAAHGGGGSNKENGEHATGAGTDATKDDAGDLTRKDIARPPPLPDAEASAAPAAHKLLSLPPAVPPRPRSFMVGF